MRSTGIQPICGYRALKQALSPICIQSYCTQPLYKEFYQTRSVLKKDVCAKAQLRKSDTEPFAIVAKTFLAKTKPIRTFDKRETLHLQPQTTEEDVSRLDIPPWRTPFRHRISTAEKLQPLATPCQARGNFNFSFTPVILVHSTSVTVTLVDILQLDSIN